MENEMTEALDTGHGAPEKNSIPGREVEHAKGQSNSPLVLDNVDEFEFHGTKYTPEELNRAILRQADYTRKTKELAETRRNLETQFGENSKYILNYRADLQRIRENPSLASEFKRIYPPEFHPLLGNLGREYSEDYETEEASENSEARLPKWVIERLKKLDRLESLEQRLEKLDSESRMREETAASKHLDDVLGRYSEKYPYAVEDAVLNMAQALIEENRENPRFRMTDGVWERIFKVVNDKYQKHFESKYRSQIESQVRRGDRASDSAPGGVAPGRGPSGPKTIREATELAIQDLKAGRIR